MDDFKSNSHKTKEKAERPERKMAPVADGTIEKKKKGFLSEFLDRDGKTIRDFLIETILIPSLLSSISGIGDIVIDSFMEGVSTAFDKIGFTSDDKRKSGHTSYNSIYDERKRRARDVEYEEIPDTRSYDNVRVKTEREAKQVIKELRALIADPEYGYATVANLYELTDNIATYADHGYGWTSLNSADYIRTRHRDKPYLLRLSRPRDLRDIK